MIYMYTYMYISDIIAKANRITPALALALAPVLLDLPGGRFTAQVELPPFYISDCA